MSLFSSVLKVTWFFTDTLWESKTLSNLREVEAQSTLVRERVRLHRGSPVSLLLKAIDQLNKGVAKMGHETVLI